MDERKKGDCQGDDFIIAGHSPCVHGVPVLRHRPDHTIEAGFIAPVKDGQSLDGELVRISRREDGGPGLAVESVYEASHPGPPRFSTNTYRDGWDRTFGSSSN